MSFGARVFLAEKKRVASDSGHQGNGTSFVAPGPRGWTARTVRCLRMWGRVGLVTPRGGKGSAVGRLIGPGEREGTKRLAEKGLASGRFAPMLRTITANH